MVNLKTSILFVRKNSVHFDYMTMITFGSSFYRCISVVERYIKSPNAFEGIVLNGQLHKKNNNYAYTLV